MFLILCDLRCSVNTVCSSNDPLCINDSSPADVAEGKNRAQYTRLDTCHGYREIVVDSPLTIFPTADKAYQNNQIIFFI